MIHLTEYYAAVKKNEENYLTLMRNDLQDTLWGKKKK